MKERSKNYLTCNCVIKHNTGEQTGYLQKPFQGTLDLSTTPFKFNHP